MLKVGLTAGIGSGKSTVAKVFETLGIPVYYADDEAKELMQSNPIIVAQIKTYFGEAAYKDGKLNRPYISKLVFNQPEKLQVINSIVHPVTIVHAANWMNAQKTPYVIKEAAIFFESGSHQHVDIMVGVYAPTALRIKRVMQRDNCTREDVLKRMEKQIDERIKMRLCDFVLQNNEQDLLLPQITELHENLKELAARKKSDKLSV